MTASSPADFAITVRVYYEDTDVGGVVYYANYLRFLERARSEWLRQLGISTPELAQKEKVIFAVRSVAISYRKPARLDDVLRVTVVPEAVRGASLRLVQACWLGTEAICEAIVELACVDAISFMPHRLPPEFSRVAVLVPAS